MSTLAYASGPTDIALLDDTIGQNLERTVREHGAREALVSVHQDIRWTYDEFRTRVRALAKGLIAAGLQTGDRVGLWSPNYAEWTLVQYATAEIGVVVQRVGQGLRAV